MKKQIFKIVGLVMLAIGLLMVGMGIPSTVKKIHANRQILPDSITTLNRIVNNQQRELWIIGHQLDSISRTGGELIYTNSDKKTFILKLTGKQ